MIAPGVWVAPGTLCAVRQSVSLLTGRYCAHGRRNTAAISFYASRGLN